MVVMPTGAYSNIAVEGLCLRWDPERPLARKS
jgi:hypothetical protein